MALALSRPPTSSSRPAYLDNLFRDHPKVPSHSKSNSLLSNTSSISYSSAASPLDARTIQPNPRPLSPAFEEEYQTADDRLSVRSLKLSLSLSPRGKLRSILHRRTYPQVQETTAAVEYPTSPPDEPTLAWHHSTSQRRRPSLPKLQTAFSSPQLQQKAPSKRISKPLPPPPGQKTRAEELKCQPCYYFHARNCNGYVLGGAHGDACETCAVSSALHEQPKSVDSSFLSGFSYRGVHTQFARRL